MPRTKRAIGRAHSGPWSGARAPTCLVGGWATQIGFVDKRVKVGVPGQGWGGLTLNAQRLSFDKKAPRRGKNGACFFEKCVSQYEAFRGVPGGVDLTVKSRKTKGNR